MFKVSTCFNLPENLIEMRSSSRVGLKKCGPASPNSRCSWGIWWLTLGLGHTPSLDKPWQTRSLWGVETGRMWQVPTQIIQRQWPRFCLYSNPLVTSMAELNQSKWFLPVPAAREKPFGGPHVPDSLLHPLFSASSLFLIHMANPTMNQWVFTRHIKPHMDPNGWGITTRPPLKMRDPKIAICPKFARWLHQNGSPPHFYGQTQRL